MNAKRKVENKKDIPSTSKCERKHSRPNSIADTADSKVIEFWV